MRQKLIRRVRQGKLSGCRTMCGSLFWSKPPYPHALSSNVFLSFRPPGSYVRFPERADSRASLYSPSSRCGQPSRPPQHGRGFLISCKAIVRLCSCRQGFSYGSCAHDRFCCWQGRTSAAFFAGCLPAKFRGRRGSLYIPPPNWYNKKALPQH